MQALQVQATLAKAPVALSRKSQKNAVKLARVSGASRHAQTARFVCKAEESVGSPSISLFCSVDDLDDCSLADLEMMYVDALWNYYHDGEFTLEDGEYDRLREELNWQGSGFPTLRRYEIEFVEAAIAFARGEPVVSDEQYEQLKYKVQQESGKRADVTALLLYTKGQQLLNESEYLELADSMKALGIDVGLRGASCTLSTTSEELKSDVGMVLQMYGALCLVPTLIGFVPYIGLSVAGVDFPELPGAGISFAIGAALGATIINYVGLNDAEILKGQCPCCENELKQFFGGPTAEPSYQVKCDVCGTSISMNRKDRKLVLVEGPRFVS